MHGTIGEVRPDSPVPAEPKRRIITLTNRAPIQIVEDEWPVIAQGRWGEDWGAEYAYGWGVQILVRRGKWYTIIHAKYEVSSPDEEQDQVVRVGRLLNADQCASNLWREILAVGDELRERILSEQHRKRIVLALDHCFAKLPPQTH